MAEMTMEHRVRCGSHTSSGVVTLPDSIRGSLAPARTAPRAFANDSGRHMGG